MRRRTRTSLRAPKIPVVKPPPPEPIRQLYLSVCVCCFGHAYLVADPPEPRRVALFSKAGAFDYLRDLAEARPIGLNLYNTVRNAIELSALPYDIPDDVVRSVERCVSSDDKLIELAALGPVPLESTLDAEELVQAVHDDIMAQRSRVWWSH